MQPTKTGLNLRRIFLLAVLLPTVIFLVDEFLLGKWATRAALFGPMRTVIVYALLVGEVGLVAWTVGRWLPHPVLSWMVYAWVLALVDLWALNLIYAPVHGMALRYALISAQVGLIAAWTILGAGPWQWRLPVVAVIAAILGYFVLPFGGIADDWTWALQLRHHGWATVFLIQSLVIVIVSAVPRFLGFQLRPRVQAGTEEVRPRSGSYLQFTIGQILVWTAALAILLTLTNGLDWLFFRQMEWSELPPAFAIGVGLAIISLISFWSALGSRGGYILRVSVLIVGVSAVGALTGWTADHVTPAVSPCFYYWFGILDDTGLWWAWTTLAAGLLAAMALIFRARGYRLERCSVHGRKSSPTRSDLC